MTIQWNLVAWFLYGEIMSVVVLLLPYIPLRFWQKLFRSRICQAFASRATLYLTVFIAVLLMFFVDSIREMRKYSHSIMSADQRHMDTEMQLMVKLFRSQRNYYISGLSLFLFFVIRRLIILIVAQADLLDEIEKTMRAAQSATDRTEKLLKEQNEKKFKESADNMENSRKESLERELSVLTEQLTRIKEELRSVKSDLTTVKEHSAAVEEEYNKLLRDHTTLQENYSRLQDSVNE